MFRSDPFGSAERTEPPINNRLLMQQRYPLLTLLFVLLAGTCARAQTTIAVMDFDGTTPEMTVTTDVAFFDNNSDGFFGIHDANGDPNDGTPTDTGDGNASDVALVNGAPISGDFLFVNDLDDEGDNGAAEATVTFGPVDVSGQTNLFFSFDFIEVGFDAGDNIFYSLVLDGVQGAETQIVNGSDPDDASGTVTAVVPDGTNSVSLLLRIDQNGDDAAGFDNFIVTADNVGTPCGITSFGPDATVACTSFTNDVNSPDGYILSIDYAGIDADAQLAVNVDNAAATFDISGGDDPTATANGTLVITSGAFLEGTDYEVVLTDGGGNCNFTVSGTVAPDACVAVCDLTATFPDDVTIRCETFTSADNADAISVEIDYTGVEPGVTVSAPGLNISGDDPATVANGTIIVTGLVEGGNYVITINGGDCTGGDAITFPIPVPENFCTPTDLVINEVLADPGTVNDANNDGNADGSEDEFIELYNTGDADLDVSGWTISEGAGVRHTFPDGFVIPARSGFVLFGGGTPNVPCLNAVANETPFIGLNNSGDEVTVRNQLGFPVAQMSYGAEGNNDQSLALDPDGDVSGGYVLHTTITNPTGSPLTHSACLENDNPQFTLPVELIAFTAAADDKRVTLNWETTEERGNDRFVVERSTDGRRWVQLGSVLANGRSNGNYRFLDEQPYAGTNVYRLRQLDLDGRATLYGPVVAEFTAGALAVYPNPATDRLRFNRAFSGDVRVELFDGAGRRLLSVTPADGTLNVSDLEPGLYLLSVREGDRTESVRFLKK